MAPVVMPSFNARKPSHALTPLYAGFADFIQLSFPISIITGPFLFISSLSSFLGLVLQATSLVPSRPFFFSAGYRCIAFLHLLSKRIAVDGRSRRHDAIKREVCLPKSWLANSATTPSFPSFISPLELAERSCLFLNTHARTHARTLTTRLSTLLIIPDPGSGSLFLFSR